MDDLWFIACVDSDYQGFGGTRGCLTIRIASFVHRYDAPLHSVVVPTIILHKWKKVRDWSVGEYHTDKSRTAELAILVACRTVSED